MGNVMSYLVTLKDLVVGKKLCEVSSPVDIEFSRIHIYHDKWAERIKKYGDEQTILTRLAENEDHRQKRLQAAPAVVQKRILKIEHKAEREEDPVKMKKYLAKNDYESQRRFNKRGLESESMQELKRIAKRNNTFWVTTP
jgi:hypothetical protein